MKALLRTASIVLAMLGAWQCAPQDARAQGTDPDCSSLPAPVIYGTGGSAQQPLIAALAAKLAGLAQPLTVVYSAPGACFGIQALNDPTTNKIKATDKATPTYWTADGKSHTCVVPAAGVAADFASMNNSAVQCQGFSKLPDGIGDFEGPINAFTFFVNPLSSQTSISAEAVYYVYGLGASAGGVQPWTNDSLLVSRSATSAAAIFVALAAGFPVTKIKGVDAMTNSASIQNVAGASDPEAGLGFASAENTDKARDKVRALAFQAKGQTCGYWPDSSDTAFDKKNVREGQYWIWSPAHFFAPVDAQGKITNPDVAKLIGYLSGSVAAPDGVDLLKLFIDNGDVPKCAMHVTRKGDLGPLASYQPDEPCGCYFDQEATGATSCTACSSDSDCKDKSAPTCRFGFCEVK